VALKTNPLRQNSLFRAFSDFRQRSIFLLVRVPGYKVNSYGVQARTYIVGSLSRVEERAYCTKFKYRTKTLSQEIFQCILDMTMVAHPGLQPSDACTHDLDWTLCTFPQAILG
jgi:hypothetical protein